jgi:hypothetical protein
MPKRFKFKEREGRALARWSDLKLKDSSLWIYRADYSVPALVRGTIRGTFTEVT